MDMDYARRMSALTKEFYEHVFTSFSATRQSSWPGWDTLLDVVQPTNDSLQVLDVACGNLRFERFLQRRGLDVGTWAWDACADLVGDVPPSVRFQSFDVAEALLAKGGEAPFTPKVDLAVSFGFMHHLPLFEQRAQLLRLMVDRTRPGGYVVVAFWQFATDARIRAKSRPVPNGNKNDFLLGWQNETGVARFCHYCDEDEIDRLVAGVPEAREVARYFADGRSGQLNRYVVLRREPPTNNS